MGIKVCARRSDSAVLPVCVASRLYDVPINLSELKGGCDVPSIIVETDNHSFSIESPMAAAKYLSLKSKTKKGKSTQFEEYSIEQWIEYAANFLNKGLRASLVASAIDPKLDLAITKLLSILKKNGKYLVGNTISLADVSVWCVLYPVLESNSPVANGIPAEVRNWFRDLSGNNAFNEGVKILLGQEPKESVCKLALADALSVLGPPRLMPKPGARNILVTSALPYVNNVPHLGNIIGCVLSADVYARYCRAREHNVIYICGTDEYGTATETKAMDEGLKPREICDKYHKQHAAIYEWFDIKFDKFGRTSTPKQTEIAQGIFNSLLDKKLLYKDDMEQLYDDVAKKFLADRFVEGTCPKCKYEDARGDQCDACGSLLNPTDLLNPRSKLSGTTPRNATTQHMFLNLPEISPRLQEYVQHGSKEHGWSANTVTITNAWIRDGLKPRCITRDLQWGVPVPMEELKDKVLYVWFDAPIGYISITADYTDDWEMWWKNKDVELVQFMGKDNVPFHTVIFPSMLIGSDNPWTLMHSISTTEYLNYEDAQFSKSRGVGVFGDQCKDTNIPSEVWRYYLLVNRPESADTKFLWSDLAAKNNSELLNNLGNFCHRTLSFVSSRFKGVLPTLGPEHESISKELGEKIQPIVYEYIQALDKLKIKDGLRIAMKVSSAGNLFFQDSQPWVVLKTDPAKCGMIISCCVGLIKLLAILLQPYVPSVSDKLWAQLGNPGSMSLTDATAAATCLPHALLPAGWSIGPAPSPIFQAISEDTIEALRHRFSGDQAKDAAAASKGASAAAKPAGKDGKPVKGDKPALDKNGKPIGKDGKPVGKDGKPAAKAAPVDPNRAVDVSRLDLRVGKIVQCEKHPDADSLYVEQIDLGEGRLRTVVSGLVKFIPLDQMIGSSVVLVANMKPQAMRGIKSEGMVLAASNAEGTKTELVTPPEGTPVGERVMVDGYPGEPDEVLNPKKKIFEGVQPDLKTTAGCVASYKGVAFKTSRGECKVISVAEGSIK